MATVGYATLQIIPSIQGVRADLTRQMGGVGADAAGQFSRAFGGAIARQRDPGGFTQFGRSIDRQMTRITRRVRLGVGLMAASFAGSVLFEGGRRLSGIDEAETKLRALGHSTQSVSKIMDNAMDAVVGTAYNFGDAAVVASSAIASGIKPGQELERYLRLTADAASLSGQELGEIGQIMNKVTADQRLMTRELNQFGQRGIPVLEMLAEHYGITSDAVREMVRNGQVDATTFREVFEKNIGGAALVMGETFQGKIRNTRAAMSRLGEALLEVPFNAFKGALDGVMRGLDFATKWVRRNGEAIQASLEPAVERLSTWFSERLVPAIRGATEWFARNWDIIKRLAGAIIPAVVLVGAFALAWVKLQGVFSAIAAFSPVGLLMLVAAGLIYAYQHSETFRDVVNRVFRAVWGVVEPILAAFGGFLRDLGDENTTAGALAKLAWERIQTVLTAVWGVIGPIVEGFLGLLEQLGDENSRLRERITDVWEGISGVFKSVASPIGDALSIVRGGLEAIGGAATGVFGDVADDASKAGEALPRAADKMAPAFDKVGNSAGDIKDKVYEATSAMTPALDETGESFANLGTKAEESSAKTDSAWTRLRDALGERFSTMGSIIGDFFRGLDLNTPQLEGINIKWGRIWGGISKAVEVAMRLMAAAVRVGTWIMRNIWEQFGADITFFISGFWNAIVKIFEGAWNILAGIVELIVSMVTGDFEGMVEASKRIVRGLFTAIEGIFALATLPLRTAFRSMLNKVREPFESFVNWIREKVDGVLSGIETAASWFGISIKLPRLLGAATGPQRSPGRMHTGGIAGVSGATGGPGRLTNDELLAILQKGEGVISVEAMERLRRSVHPQHELENAYGGPGDSWFASMLDKGKEAIGNVKDLGADVIAGARSMIADKVMPLLDSILGPIYRGIDAKTGRTAPFFRGIVEFLVKTGTNWLKGVSEGVEAKALTRMTKDANIGTGSIGGSWRSLIDYIRGLGVHAMVTSTYRHGDRGYHGRGKAVDFSVGGHGNRGYGSAGLRAIFNAFLPIAGSLAELILAGAPFNIKHGRKVGGYAWGRPGQRGNHWNHVHAAVFDRGGLLYPGWNLVRNATGSPEMVSPVTEYDREWVPTILVYLDGEEVTDRVLVRTGLDRGLRQEVRAR